MFIQHEELCLNLQQCVYFKLVNYTKGQKFNGADLEVDSFGIEYGFTQGNIVIMFANKGDRDGFFAECALIGKIMIANILKAAQGSVVKASPVVMPFKH